MRPQLLSLAIVLGSAAMAQGRAVVPRLAETLPGNAAVSMPLRWSHGIMQVCIAPVLLPANFVGQQIRGLRLRRPALLDEPAYAAVQRTLTVRACFAPIDPVVVSSSLTANRPAALQVVAGPAVFLVAASVPPAGVPPTGAEFLVIPFPVPLQVAPGNLFLEFEAGDAPLAIDEPWVDAVWMTDGIDHGFDTAVGNGACTTRNEPLELRWTAAGGPVRGTDAALQLTGATPGAGVFAWAGIEPETHATGAAWFGFGGPLGGLDPALAACRLWAPLDATFLGTAASDGSYTVSFPLLSAITTTSMRVGVQALFLDFARPGLPLSISNGVMLVLDSARVDNRCSTVFFPGAATISPWGAQFGLMPVVVLDL